MTEDTFVKEDRSKRTPMALLSYQQRWLEDDADVKIIEKSRRIGLSWAEAADDALLAASQSGMDVWYIGYNKDMAQEFIEDCGDWLKHYDKAASEVEEFVFDDEDKDILAFRIRCASGHKIVALSSRPSNLRGKQGKVVIDEAAFHDNLGELIKAAMALLMWGGKVVIISTHDGDSNHFNEVIQEVRAGKKPYSLHRVTLDDALAEGLYERICLRLGKEWSQEAEEAWRKMIIAQYGDGADEELFCIPSAGGGTYLTRAVIERCMREDIPILRWACKDEFAILPDHIRQAEARDWCEEHLAPLLAQLDPNRAHYFGEDFARTGDLSVFVPLAEEQNLKYRAPFVVELANVPFKEQELILYYIVDRLPRFTRGNLDSRGNGQYLGERAMQKYGPERIGQIMLSEAWYREEMPRFKSFFDDGTIEVPKDADHMDDYRAIKMIKGVAKLPDTKTKGKDGRQRHGDAAIAVAMGVAATRAEACEYAYHPVTAKDMHDMERPVSMTAGFGRIQGAW
jgi:phage FluMu gp28-like protein